MAPPGRGALVNVTNVAIVDGASFVLPYDFQLIAGLARRGVRVTFYGSTTRYNAEFLDAMRALPGVEVRCRAVSGSVSARWRGVAAYAALLAGLLWRALRRSDSGRPGHSVVNLQFSVLWPLELPVCFGLRRRLVFTVHNAVPHGFRGQQHRPTLWLATLARSLLFASTATHDDFMQRYGMRFAAKSYVLPHGLLPVVPTLTQPTDPAYLGDSGDPKDAARHDPPRALVFWSTVKPYKGVELFGALARSEAVRARGLALRVVGAWAAELNGLRAELAGLGVAIEDAYLGPAPLLQLLAAPAVFVLPYREASQSGALYSLLFHGCTFICADVGDLGAFMRRFGLQGLLLKERSVEAVLDCLDWLAAHRAEVAAALREAQRQLGWDVLLAAAAPLYGLPTD